MCGQGKGGYWCHSYQLTLAVSALIKLHANPQQKFTKLINSKPAPLPAQHIPHLHGPHTAHPLPGTSRDGARICTLPLWGWQQSKHSSKFAFCNPDFCKTVNLTGKLEKPPTGFIAWSYSARMSVLAISPSSALHLSSTSDAKLCRAKAASMQWCYSIALLHANFS